MRHLLRFVPPLAIVGAMVCGPSIAIAQERASLEGFGGVSLNSLTSESFTPSLGGTLTFNVAPAVQIIGEADASTTCCRRSPTRPSPPPISACACRPLW